MSQMSNPVNTGIPSAEPAAVYPSKPKSKKNLVIVAVILVFLCICCALSAVVGLLILGANSSSEKQVADRFFKALNEGDQATLQEVTDANLYNILNQQYSDGTIAEHMKGSISNVKYLSTNSDGSLAQIRFNWQVNNQEQATLSTYHRIDLRKSAATNTWLVMYLGPDTTSN
ncbi:MAG: hypothetical protein WCJ58_02470 [bacterium]